MSGEFGQKIREIRVAKEITLRQFCMQAEVDPSNWSKIERGLIAPPTDLDKICAALDIQPGSPEWHELSNLSHLERGMLPKTVLDNEQVMAALPIFFRTARGEKPTAEELEQVIEVIRNS